MGLKYFFALAIIISLLSIGSVSAGPVAYGYVTITIINNAPELSNLRVDETSFECEADIVDENPGTTRIMKQFFANGSPVDKSKIRYGDEVRCELLPIDELGQEGAIYVLEFKMPKPSISLGIPIRNIF